MHAVAILLINIACQSYVMEHTLTNLTKFHNNDIMHEETHQYRYTTILHQ